MNNDGLDPTQSLSQDDYWRVHAQYAAARTAVIRGEQPDFATAMAQYRT